MKKTGRSHKGEPVAPRMKIDIVVTNDQQLKRFQTQWARMSDRERRQRWPKDAEDWFGSSEVREKSRKTFVDELMRESEIGRMMNVDATQEQREKNMETLIGFPLKTYDIRKDDPVVTPFERLSLERYVSIGKQLWAQCSQERGPSRNSLDVRTAITQFRKPYVLHSLSQLLQLHQKHIASLEPGGGILPGIATEPPLELLSQAFFPTCIRSIPFDPSDTTSILNQPPFITTEELTIEALWGRHYRLEHAPTPPDDIYLYLRMYDYMRSMFEFASIAGLMIDISKTQWMQRAQQENIARVFPEEQKVERKKSVAGMCAEFVGCSILSRFCLLIGERAAELPDVHSMPMLMMGDELYDHNKIDAFIDCIPLNADGSLTSDGYATKSRTGIQISSMHSDERYKKMRDFFHPSYSIAQRRKELGVDRLGYLNMAGTNCVELVETWRRTRATSFDAPEMGLLASKLKSIAEQFLRMIPELTKVLSAAELVEAWRARYPQSYAARYPNV